MNHIAYGLSLRQIDAAIKADRVQPSVGMQMLRDYERGLDDYTYLSF